ncbi:MAG TPA: response regulator [Chloroflexota bacterium]|nr:response regulator [Chloroflexota bacterium]
MAEDYPEIRELVSDIFRNAGYRVESVSRGSDVGPAIRRFHPSVVLLDLALPDVPGNDVLQQLAMSPETNRVPVIIMSAYSERLRQVPQVRAVVNKPFDIELLLRAVEEAQQPRAKAA